METVDFIARFLPQFLATVIGGASVYAGIRVAIARLEEKVASTHELATRALKVADSAHDRINSL